MPSAGAYKLSPDDVAAVVRLAREGIKTGELAARYDCSDTHIRTIRKLHGVNAKTGRAETKPTRTVVCRMCGREFTTKRDGQVVCGASCKMAALHAGRWKLPSDATERRTLLMRLYWAENRTSPEIAQFLGMSHKSILHAMRCLDIPRRGMGKRKDAHCIEDQCSLPIYRIRHKTNGSMYGRRCYLHWVIYRMLVNQRYNDKTVMVGKDESWLRRMRQLLRRVQRLNREVSRSLKPESEPATTSPA